MFSTDGSQEHAEENGPTFAYARADGIDGIGATLPTKAPSGAFRRLVEFQPIGQSLGPV
jgi:hypothetical protein